MALVYACVFCHLLLCLYGDTRPWTWGSLVNLKAFTSRSLLQDISKDLPPTQSCTHASQGAPPFFLGGGGHHSTQTLSVSICSSNVGAIVVPRSRGLTRSLGCRL